MTDSERDPEQQQVIDRAEQFAAGPPGISRRVIWITLAAAAVLGIGGAFADHSFDVQPAPTAATVHHAAAQSTSLASFVGLRVLAGKPAPAIPLREVNGQLFNLAAQLGRPLLITFLPASCGQDCPVIAAELRGAAQKLAASDIHPTMVVVNADPDALGALAVREALAAGPLANLPGAVFVSGPLATMQKVWTAYGVSIELDPTTQELAYTDVIYLVDQKGDLRDALTPFANESRSGAATLPAAQLTRFALGIATYLEKIAS